MSSLQAGGEVEINNLTMVQRERILIYLLGKLHKLSQDIASRSSGDTFATQQIGDGGSHIRLQWATTHTWSSK